MEFTVKVENRLTLYLANTKPSVWPIQNHLSTASDPLIAWHTVRAAPCKPMAALAQLIQFLLGHLIRFKSTNRHIPIMLTQ